MSAGHWTIAPLSVHHPDAAALLRGYFGEITRRYHGRPVPDEELDRVLVEESSDDLTAPTGHFLVGRYGGRPAGCVGLRVLDADAAEVTRLFVHPAARGTGGGARLLAAAERAAGEVFGARAVRLDTRGDLVEARALYARSGYREIPDYNGDRYADHWYEKRLAGPPGG
ncbi:GNAT family N-acetyltransferase [Streptomyces sp. TRM 70361]|uniref:GNAT family N-acetyltransferase n=1 Tax=Streptomyces sp. TRM 70361 TaxID=3116553 RepID=UPI002E7AF3CF|nr:GNAT family N-acetyltransferase [Streptomyces sp. TRM 70361]MEE1941271.1 GNAT family N-acetyltransferase [Streptomyces sp. TRM 70361]